MRVFVDVLFFSKGKAIRCLFAAALLVHSSCQNTTAPELEPSETQIRFFAAGGIMGGTWYKLSIAEDGLATNELVEPHLQQQLSSKEHREILALFENFFSFQELYDRPNCDDDVAFEITYTTGNRTKTVTAWGCAIQHNAATNPDLAQIKKIIDTLSALAKRIYEQEAPWIGLRADFRLEKDTYSIGEPITLHYTIYNPTGKMRTLYFPFTAKTGFRISKQAFPGFYFDYPEQREKVELTSIDFQPGEEKKITMQWNQVVIDGKGNRSSLQLGRYYLIPFLLDTGYLGVDTSVVFDVVDKSIPLAGYIEPDYNGESRDSPTYTFKLVVRNWTDMPIALNFPYRQKIAIRLYDLNGPASNTPPLLFEGPQARDAEPSTMALQPNEETTFTQAFAKRELNLTYMWYLVEVKLLAENFEFMRDGQVRIFR